MYKLWQTKPELEYPKTKIIDIIQHGSSTKTNNPNDIDIAIIYKNTPIKEQLTETQKIKMQLEKHTDKPIHTTPYDYNTFFDEGNFAMHNILLEGRSIITGKYFAEKLGFTPHTEIKYTLKGKEKKEKIKFNYTLNGKQKKYGLLKKYGGTIIAPGLIRIKPEHEQIFKEKLEKQTKITTTKTLIKKQQ